MRMCLSKLEVIRQTERFRSTGEVIHLIEHSRLTGEVIHRIVPSRLMGEAIRLIVLSRLIVEAICQIEHFLLVQRKARPYQSDKIVADLPVTIRRSFL